MINVQVEQNVFYVILWFFFNFYFKYYLDNSKRNIQIIKLIIYTYTANTASKDSEYFTAFFKTIFSFPFNPTVAATIERLWSDIIVPSVAPTVLEATSQYLFIPKLSAATLCKEPKSRFAEVLLPVINVPIAPINGAIKG